MLHHTRLFNKHRISNKRDLGVSFLEIIKRTDFTFSKAGNFERKINNFRQVIYIYVAKWFLSCLKVSRETSCIYLVHS